MRILAKKIHSAHDVVHEVTRDLRLRPRSLDDHLPRTCRARPAPFFQLFVVACSSISICRANCVARFAAELLRLCGLTRKENKFQRTSSCKRKAGRRPNLQKAGLLQGFPLDWSIRTSGKRFVSPHAYLIRLSSKARAIQSLPVTITEISANLWKLVSRAIPGSAPSPRWSMSTFLCEIAARDNHMFFSKMCFGKVKLISTF